MEVENDSVINNLLQKTALQSVGYHFLHQDSPDLRGLDVALIYLPEKFNVIHTQYLRVATKTKPTRDILFASGILPNNDTLHLFVNHWPSRYNDESERYIAAKTVKQVTDSLFNANVKSNIIIMGDFNDQPSDSSLTQGLGVINEWTKKTSGRLYNLCARFEEMKQTGTYKYKGEWQVLDQFIVSGELLNNQSSTYTSSELVYIGNFPFLLEKDKAGKTPKRSFRGNFFTNGFSDHLPIYLDLVY
jgi:endonuclease/exonuclease/phosphatase family metal-dependent hydrolase